VRTVYIKRTFAGLLHKSVAEDISRIRKIFALRLIDCNRGAMYDDERDH